VCVCVCVCVCVVRVCVNTWRQRVADRYRSESLSSHSQDARGEGDNDEEGWRGRGTVHERARKRLASEGEREIARQCTRERARDLEGRGGEIVCRVVSSVITRMLDPHPRQVTCSSTSAYVSCVSIREHTCSMRTHDESRAGAITSTEHSQFAL
jgi:hypothetical protein